MLYRTPVNRCSNPSGTSTNKTKHGTNRKNKHHCRERTHTTHIFARRKRCSVNRLRVKTVDAKRDRWEASDHKSDRCPSTLWSRAFNRWRRQRCGWAIWVRDSHRSWPLVCSVDLCRRTVRFTSVRRTTLWWPIFSPPDLWCNRWFPGIVCQGTPTTITVNGGPSLPRGARTKQFEPRMDANSHEWRCRFEWVARKSGDLEKQATTDKHRWTQIPVRHICVHSCESVVRMTAQQFDRATFARAKSSAQLFVRGTLTVTAIRRLTLWWPSLARPDLRCTVWLSHVLPVKE